MSSASARPPAGSRTCSAGSRDASRSAPSARPPPPSARRRRSRRTISRPACRRRAPRRSGSTSTCSAMRRCRSRRRPRSSLRSSSTCRSVALLAGLAVLCSLQAVQAIDPNRALSQYVRDEWTAENGFPGGAISAITQTTDGYLWIGSEKGLVRFDGFTFRLVQHARASGFANSPVLGLIADADGSRWAGLQGPTLVHYPRGDLDSVSPDVAIPNSLVTAMCRAADGKGLFFSSIRQGVLAYRGGGFSELAPRTSMPASFVIAMAQTPAGEL